MNKRGYRAYIKNLNSAQDIKIKNKNNFGNIVSSFNNFIKGKPDWKKEKNKRCSFYEFQKERDYCMEVYSPYTSYPELAQDNLNRETISRDLKEGIEFYEKAWQNYKDRNYFET